MNTTVAELVQVENKFGVPVRYNPNQRGVAFARGVFPFKRIEVGVPWFGLPSDEQQAVLAHEAGHAFLFHMEIRWLLLPFCWTKWAQRIARGHELAADAYAVDLGHGFGLLRFIRRAARLGMGRDADAALLCPTPAERERRLLHLLQERHL